MTSMTNFTAADVHTTAGDLDNINEAFQCLPSDKQGYLSARDSVIAPRPKYQETSALPGERNRDCFTTNKHKTSTTTQNVCHIGHHPSTELTQTLACNPVLSRHHPETTVSPEYCSSNCAPGVETIPRQAVTGIEICCVSTRSKAARSRRRSI